MLFMVLEMIGFMKLSMNHQVHNLIFTGSYSKLKNRKFIIDIIIRLEKFQPIDFSPILPSNAGSELSSLWKVSIEESKLLNKD